MSAATLALCSPCSASFALLLAHQFAVARNGMEAREGLVAVAFGQAVDVPTALVAGLFEQIADDRLLLRGQHVRFVVDFATQITQVRGLVAGHPEPAFFDEYTG